jgi:hypothetical protein
MSTRAIAIGLFTTMSVLAACLQSTQNESSGSELSAQRSMNYTLPGFDETVLVGDSNGMAEIVRVGAVSTKVAISGMPKKSIIAGTSRAGSFRVLTSDGKIVTIDSGSARATMVATKIAQPVDLAFDDHDPFAFVSAGSKIYKLDAVSGSVVASIDLADAARKEKISVGKILVRGDRILVQVRRELARVPIRGAIAVVNTTTTKLERLIELAVTDPIIGAFEGSQPGGPFIVDEATNSIFVTALGSNDSPKNGGMLRLNKKTLELAPSVFHFSSFQGPIAFGPSDSAPRYAFTGEHTRTPTNSTHLQVWTVDAAGGLKKRSETEGPILNAFEELLSFPMNHAQTLFAWPVVCPAGFCVGGGIGSSFVNTRSAAIYPRLTKAELGLEPSFVLFAQP